VTRWESYDLARADEFWETSVELIAHVETEPNADAS
jgi:hypothetical protein